MTAGKHWHWGTSIAIVYTVFASATLGFAIFAMNQDVDLVSPGYYADAMSYDTHQAAAERALGLAIDVTLEIESATGGRSLVVGFPQSARPETGTITLYRAANAGADRTIVIDSALVQADGRLQIPVAPLASGPWIVRVRWRTSALEYYAERRVLAR